MLLLYEANACDSHFRVTSSVSSWLGLQGATVGVNAHISMNFLCFFVFHHFLLCNWSDLNLYNPCISPPKLQLRKELPAAKIKYSGWVALSISPSNKNHYTRNIEMPELAARMIMSTW